VASDGDGNVYIAGYTAGPEEQTDAWLAKYSAAGALRWKRQLGTSYFDPAWGVASDGDGNVYIAGYTTGSLGGPQQGGVGREVFSSGCIALETATRNGGL
jgi:hypothetical protein